MNKDNLYINDTSFSHAPSASWYNHPKKFNWIRNKDNDTNEIFLTDLTLVDRYMNKKVYGWLIEPPSLMPAMYEFATKNFNKFEKIFTYDKNLLNLSDKFELLPIGGCWIDEQDRLIHKKSSEKIVCTITSNKTMTKGHRFRRDIISNLSNVDIFGHGYRSIAKKIDVLKDYMFCIVIENNVMDYLFTEKLIDCLITGTIPIYCGCPSIGDFFNVNGILTFKNSDELKYIIPKLNEDLYKSKMEYIKENFELAKKYVVADDIIYEKVKKM